VRRTGGRAFELAHAFKIAALSFARIFRPPAVATLAAFIAVLNVARSGARAPPRSLVTDARFASANADGATVRRSRRAWNASAGCAPRAAFGFLFVTADAWPLRGFGCTSADVSAAA
jgi:hypothetical protein